MRRGWLMVSTVAAITGVALGYALAGPLGGYLAAATVLVVVACSLVATVPVADKSPRRIAQPPSAPRDADFGGVGRLDMEVLDSLHSGRIFDHALRPRLYRIARVLVQQRSVGAAGPSTVRAHVGEDLWRLLDPPVRSFEDTPKVTAQELDQLLSRLEELT